MLFLMLACVEDIRVPPIEERGVRFVFIPAGRYPIGSEDEWTPVDEKPSFWARTEGFFLMEAEVTNEQYSNYLNEHQMSPEEVSMDIGLRGYSTRPTEIVHTGKRYRPSMGYEDHPISAVGYRAAQSYCQWLGGRLPTEFEWEIGARGSTSDRRYPWGDEEDPSKANIGQRWKQDGRMPTTAVKSYPPNAFGVYDIIGNVAEWTQSKYQGYPGTEKSIRRDDSSHRMVVRGGDWYSSWDTARVAFRQNMEINVRGLWNGGLGFRCLREKS